MSQEEFFNKLKWISDGTIPCVIQDEETKRVLTLCYMTKEALEKTLQEKYVYVFRRSLNRLMKKGESSGHIQQVKRISVDCEGKSLLVEIRQHVAGCHKGYFSCYYEELDEKGELKIQEKLVFDPKEVYQKKG